MEEVRDSSEKINSGSQAIKAEEGHTSSASSDSSQSIQYAVSEAAGEVSKLAGEFGNLPEKQRDVPVSALVRLLGIPTNVELQYLETKLDAISAKLTGLIARIERLSEQVILHSNAMALERMEYQITEIRTMLRHVLPKIVASGEIDAVHSSNKGSNQLSSGAMSMSSITDTLETKSLEEGGGEITSDSENS